MSQEAKPVVGISSCLLGEAVRYDGGHQRQSSIVEHLTVKNSLFSFCPEVSAQLGTPRPPIELIATDSTIQALGRDDPSLNVTKALNDVATVLIDQLKARNAVAYIFKARSPSCGIGTTPLFNADKEFIGVTDGLIARAVSKKLPDLIIIDESAVNSTEQCERFNMACKLANTYQFGRPEGIKVVVEQSIFQFPSLKQHPVCQAYDWQQVLCSHLLPVLTK